MCAVQRIKGLIGSTAYDAHGEILGTVTEIFTARASGQPEFATVNYGIFHNFFTLVPRRGHRLIDDHLHMAFAKHKMQNAPSIVNNGYLSNRIRNQLLRHYGLSTTEDVTVYIPLDRAGRKESFINPSIDPVR